MRQQAMKTLFTVGILALIFSSTGLAGEGFDERQTCPVMPGRPVKEKFFVDYNGQRIYLCCAPCIKAFKKHPGKYLKN